MTEKQFEVTISSNNKVHFTENDIDVISIGFNEYSDAVDCKNALLPFCNRLNNLSEENKELKEDKKVMFEILDAHIRGIESEKGIAPENENFQVMMRHTLNCLKRLKHDFQNPVNYLRLKMMSEFEKLPEPPIRPRCRCYIVPKELEKNE